MSKRVQTTYTFDTVSSATAFKRWLVRNESDRDYGHPKFIDLRDVGSGLCVEYAFDSNNQIPRGVAIGIDQID